MRHACPPTSRKARPSSTRRRRSERRQSSSARRHEAELFTRYHRDGDPAAREALAERFLPLARSLARRYERANEPLEDLVQVASLGLLKAIDRYDPARGDSFSSFAVPTILGELKRYFRNTSWALHVPRGMQERVLVVGDAVERLSSDLGRSPSAQQVAAFTDLSVEHVLEAMEAAGAYNTTSLDSARRNGDDDDAGTVADTVGGTDDGYELVEGRATIGRGLRALPERQREILYLRFVEGLTQAEIGQRVGISQMHVSRQLRRAIGRARLVANGG